MMDQNDQYSGGCVAFNLRRASRIVTKRYERALKSLNITSFQFTALATLSTHESIAQTALADTLGMDISTLNRNLRPLLNSGALQEHPKQDDARVKLISITTEGRELFKKAQPLWEQAQKKTLAHMSEAQWNTLKSAIQKLA